MAHRFGKSIKRIKKLSKLASLRTRRAKHDNEEESPEKLIICPKCKAVFFNKKWYSKNQLKEHLKNEDYIKKAGGFAKWYASQEKSKMVCEADRQRKDYSEGVVYIKNIPVDKKDEIMNLILNIEKRAKKRDIEDRIVDTKLQGKNITLYTSENQLAVSIGKQIDRAYKGGKLEIKFSKNEDATRVYLIY